MKPALFPILAAQLQANEDGSIYTNTGAIIHLNSLFCEAIDLLRIQNKKQFQKIQGDLRATPDSWTDPKQVLLRNQSIVSGGRTFTLQWQATNAQMNCNIEYKGCILNEVQKEGARQLNLVLAAKHMPTTILATMIGQPASMVVDLENYFSTIRGAIVKDAANLGANTHFTLEMPAIKE